MTGRRYLSKQRAAKGGPFELVKTVVYAVLIAVVIRTVAFEPFNIPSESMLPTLLVGDYLFVSKYAYGYSKHSLPWIRPNLSGRFIGRAPERGDVAVFKLPSDGSTDYIKRIVGLPGDHIQMKGGQLFIDDKPVPRERVADFTYRGRFGTTRTVEQYRETTPDGTSYMTLDANRSTYDDTDVYVVPEGYYFAMGDNRDNSLDSRVSSPRGVGFVPAENLVGRAEILFFSTNGEARWWEIWRWPATIRFARLLQTVSG
jgi:signal peptidase I